MLVGSTECGKSTFAKEILLPQLRFEDEATNTRFNVQYLSSDGIRQEVLGHDYDKYDQIMLEASETSFRLLFEKLRLVTSFPINAEFVVVDTTGLAEDFRGRVREIARENNYNLEVVLFDYKKREDYYASERSKRIITNHLNRLRKEVLGSLSREGYGKIHKIRAKDFFSPEEAKANPDYRIVVEDRDDYLVSCLPADRSYIVVGDVHERVEELQGLLEGYGFKLENGKLLPTEKTKDAKVILVGDWIDKGKRTRETVDFLYENRERFLFVLGNHENFVSKYIRGEIESADEELVRTYFDSIASLKEDPELLARFEHLVSLSKPFYKFNGVQTPTFFVTHAPCRNKYIGKLDRNSVRHQRNFRIDRSAPLEEQLAFLQEEAVGNHPYHLFGHVAAKNAFRIKNKLHLDTGCVHGNALTSVALSFKPFFKLFKARAAILEDDLPVLFQSERRVSVAELGEDEAKRLRYCARNRINFISGTMSPADKDEAAGDLESLRRGLDYYAQRGANRVVLQPKYMGSRCNVYLSRDVGQCFAVSRNGYRIKQVDLTPIYGKLLERFGDYMAERGIALLVLDGELLPWKAIGDGLIERQFKPIGKALETELAFLKENGFEQAFGSLVFRYEESGFEKDQFTVSKTELSAKYGDSVYQNYKHLHELRQSYVPLSDHIDAYETYRRQIELYGEDAELEYKPFALLKEVYENGEERVPEGLTSETFRFLSDDEFAVLDLADPDSYLEAERFFSKLTVDHHMEGVVIKPETDDVPGIAPYLKVRNPEYLSIIYGYDYRFPHKYGKLIKQKNIAQKLRTSVNEHRLGKRLLEVRFEEISPDNEVYRETAANLLFEVAKEKVIDPRL